MTHRVASAARAQRPTTLAGAVLLAGLLLLIAALSYLALQPVTRAEPPPPQRSVAAVEPPHEASRLATPPALRPESAAPLAPASTSPARDRVAPQPADMPYRFIGRSGSGAESAIVLFGRGRVVTLHAPGPLDDEYAVEAVFDDYLVVRHRATGVGTFMPLSQRVKAIGPHQDPEESPQD